MKKVITGIVLSTLVLSANAQVEDQNQSGLQIKAANVSFGLSSGNSAISNLSDFRKLAPNSDFEESDVAGFNAQNSFLGSSGPAFSMNVVLTKSTNENWSKLNPEFRFGISYQQADIFNLSYGREDEFRVDTLISSRNGEQVYIDSTYTQDYYLAYTQQQVMFDADVTISTNSTKRFKFYGGLGFSLGLSVSPSTSIAYSTSSRLDQQEIRTDGFDSGFDIEGSQERFRNESGFYGRLYLPLGLDFRIGKRKESLKKYHIFVESRPSVSFQSVPELNTMMTTTSVVSCFGLRYEF